MGAIATGAPTVFVGVDENGLGPRLGPLLVTAVAFEGMSAREARPRALTSNDALVGDSKLLASHADASLGEAWARALVTALGGDASSPASIVEALSLDPIATLQRPCPRDAAGALDAGAAICWSRTNEQFVATEAQVAACSASIERWARRTRPLRPVSARSVIVCPLRLNEQRAAGVNKLAVDLHAMERLVLAAADARPSATVDAVCGKVGGSKGYTRMFGPLGGRLVAIEEETQGRSAYRFPGLGAIAFVRDADANDALVGLASLVGKYLRELLMRRIVEHLRALGLEEGVELGSASGYHDPVTARFVDASALTRRRAKVPDGCFVRTA